MGCKIYFAFFRFFLALPFPPWQGWRRQAMKTKCVNRSGRSSLLRRIVSLQPGTRYTKDGISVDIDDVKDGEVYVRRWPKGVTTQPFFANCIRMPVAQFVEQVQGATMEATLSRRLRGKPDRRRGWAALVRLLKAFVCWWRGHRIRWSVDDSDDQCQYCGTFIYCPKCGERLASKPQPSDPSSATGTCRR